MSMQNCHDDVVAFHNEKVTLPNSERTEMRERRDANRRRLNSGLDANGDPRPRECRSQGSYAMRTMVQHPERDYDIDDGVYFDKEQLVGPRGADKTALDAKKMLRDAVAYSRFRREPEVRKNCVRVFYEAGYHVDLPVYRRVRLLGPLGVPTTRLELASSDWKESDPQSVTEWFLDANGRRSPDSSNGGQMRRIVRLVKAFARSRPSWQPRIASGFMITKLVVDCYEPAPGRDDLALYRTIAKICAQLSVSLEIAHPTVPGEMLTHGRDDARARFLAETLQWAVEQLQLCFRQDCSRKDALAKWDRVFATDFFSDRLTCVSSKPATLIGGAYPSRPPRNPPRRAVDKQGGGRYA